MVPTLNVTPNISSVMLWVLRDEVRAISKHLKNVLIYFVKIKKKENSSRLILFSISVRQFSLRLQTLINEEHPPYLEVINPKNFQINDQ